MFKDFQLTKLPNVFITESGTGPEKAQAHNQADYFSTVEYGEPMLLNAGEHPRQKQWYKDLSSHLKEVIDKFKNYTPDWSQKRVPWKVADLIIKQEDLNEYGEFTGKFKNYQPTMPKFLVSEDNKALRKDVLQRMLFGQSKSTAGNLLTSGIEIPTAIGYTPWTYFIDLGVNKNNQSKKFCEEQNNWSIKENNAVFIAIQGSTVEGQVKLTDNDLDKLCKNFNIDIDKNFKGCTVEEKMCRITRDLHKAGYRAVWVSKGMAFKSTTVPYIEVVIHFKDGGSLDKKRQGGARMTSGGVRFDGKQYVPKTAGYEFFSSFSNSTGITPMRQVLYTLQNSFVQSMNNKKPSPNCSDVTPDLFYKTITVGSNINGKWSWMDEAEAYTYCNNVEIVTRMMSIGATMLTDVTLPQEAKETLDKIANHIGNLKHVNQSVIGNNLKGKNKLPKLGNKKIQLQRNQLTLMKKCLLCLTLF